MGHTALRRVVWPVVPLIGEVALQVSGYKNVGLAVFLLIAMTVLALYAAWPWLRRRSALPPFHTEGPQTRRPFIAGRNRLNVRMEETEINPDFSLQLIQGQDDLTVEIIGGKFGVLVPQIPADDLRTDEALKKLFPLTAVEAAKQEARKAENARNQATKEDDKG